MHLNTYLLKWRGDWEQSNWYIRFLLALIFITPLIAMFNGWWLGLGKSDTGSPGQTVAILILIGSTAIGIIIKKKNVILICALLLSFLISTIAEYMFSGHLLMSSLVWFSRIYMTATIFISARSILTAYRSAIPTVRGWLEYSGLIITWSLIIARILGVGFHTYSDGAGFKGLFYGQNDLTASLSMLLPLIVFRFIRRKTLLRGISVAATVYAMIMIGTKTAMGSAFLTLLVFAFLWVSALLQGRHSERSEARRYLLLAMIVLIIIIALAAVFSPAFHKLLNHQLYFFNHSNNLLTYLLSGRGNTIPYVFHILGNHPWSIVMGVGYQTGNNLMESLAGYPIILEFDPLSVLLSGGLLCIAILICIYSPVIRRAWSWRKSQPHFWTAFSLLLGVISSVLAGHVMESALAGTYLSVVAALFTNDWTARAQTQSKSEHTSGGVGA